ncbi:hypothetical protein ACR79B_11215 [Sphingobacterium spiritivorum]|uniref:hypothetical protein n=1 Tax=Sphingobacterium spiritivorum TaxID=258 RepID=UPI003DA6B966
MGKRHTTFAENGDFVSSFREGGSALVTNKSGSAKAKSNQTTSETIGSVTPNKTEFSGSRDWVPWGKNDKFPDEVLAAVRKSGVANSAIRLLVYKLFGQQVVPVIEEGLDDNLQMKYTLVKDENVKNFLKRSNFDVLRISMIQDYTYFANAFPMLLMNESRSEIVKIGYDKARKFRYKPYNQSSGRIEQAIRSANFPTPGEGKEKEDIAVIHSLDWYEEVERVKYADNALKYVFPTSFPDPQFDYYSLAYFDGIRTNGWLDISNSIPEYKRSIFRNQSSIKYHIKISMTYWLKKYPKWNTMTDKERTDSVDKELDVMDQYLTGTENAMRTFVSFFDMNKVTNKPDEGIIIEALDDKLKSDAYLPDGAAANAEILFSMLVNPALFGVGMPGGNYTGGANNGGSNIRESWLVMNAINSADRAVLYQVFDFVREYNGWNPDMKLITLDKVLTTTDTGRGSKIVS